MPIMRDAGTSAAARAHDGLRLHRLTAPRCARHRVQVSSASGRTALHRSDCHPSATGVRMHSGRLDAASFGSAVDLYPRPFHLMRAAESPFADAGKTGSR